MLPRFFAPGLDEGATAVTLDPDETHHLAHVLRLRPGDAARVFDGHGREWQGAVGSIDKRAAVVDGLRRVDALPEARVGITLVAGLLKGPAMDTLVRDAVVLGVDSIVPVHTEFSSVSRKADALGALHARWRRIVVGACKQCGRAVVPVVEPPRPLDAALAQARGVALILVEPTANPDAVRRLDSFTSRAVEQGATIAVGPEGGWSPAELALASRAGFHAWSLGTQVLRAENIPVAAISIARYAWEG